MSNSIENRDRLLDIKPVEPHPDEEKHPEWNYCCSSCGSERVIVHPTGIVYRPHTIHDFSDLPEKEAKRLKKLPNIVEAVLIAMNNSGYRLFVECMSCGSNQNGFYNERPNHNGENYAEIKNKQKFKKWLMRVYAVDEVLEL